MMFKKTFDIQNLLHDLQALRQASLACFRTTETQASQPVPVSPSVTGGSFLRALAAAALTLPGLGWSPPLPASEAGAALNPEVSAISAQAYVPTGASRLSGTLAKNADSVKRYSIHCYDDGSGKPAAMRLRIQGKTKAAAFNIKATLERNGEQQQTMDVRNGDGLYAPYLKVTQGEGDYILTISKVKKSPNHPDKKLTGKAVFETRQECDTQSGAYTGIRKAVPIP